MLITITGNAGSGKSSAARSLAEKLGYEYISIGEIKRKIADQMGINISDFNKLGEKPENQQEFDLKYEDYQKTLDPRSNIVLEGRLSFWCQPKSFKIFLSVDDKIAAQRIFEQKRGTDEYNSREALYEATKQRNQEDIARYEKLYGVNYQDPKYFDFVLDTTNKNMNETVDILIQKFYDFSKSHAII